MPLAESVGLKDDARVIQLLESPANTVTGSIGEEQHSLQTSIQRSQRLAKELPVRFVGKRIFDLFRPTVVLKRIEHFHQALGHRSANFANQFVIKP